MTANRVRAQQTIRPPKPGGFVRVTIAAASPLTVNLPGATTPVPGVKMQGFTYTVGATAWAWWQEPLVGPVFPIA